MILFILLSDDINNNTLYGYLYRKPYKLGNFFFIISIIIQLNDTPYHHLFIEIA